MSGASVRNSPVRWSALALTAALFTVAPAAAQDIDNTHAFGGGGVGYLTIHDPVGPSEHATFGQTFTVGSETSLDSFEFWLKDAGNGGDLRFSAYVGDWDGSKLTKILWSSDESAPFSGSTSATFERYVFSPGGLALSSGETYVAFLNVSKHWYAPPAGWAFAVMGTTGQDSYGGGGMRYLPNGSDFSRLTTDAWSGSTQDLAFRADFSASTSATVTPEPGTWLLLATGLAGLGVAARRRKDEAVEGDQA